MKKIKISKSSNLNTSFLAGALLFSIVIAVFSPVTHHEFINYDDHIYITENPIVCKGLTLEGLVWAFTDTSTASWYPLTWLSHMLDCQIFGLNPGGHHLVSLLIHAINSLLLFYLFRRLTNRLMPSLFLALIFALHPMHVEPVAWASSRKDLLSAFFWIITMWSYTSYASKGGIARYLLVLIFFLLGFMSKPMLVTIPFILLLMDYWPLHRIDFGQSNRYSCLPVKITVPPKSENNVYIKLISEKIPFFIISLAMIFLSYLAQKKYGAVADFDTLPMFARITNIIVSYVSYIYKFIIPVKLSVHYPLYLPLPVWKVFISLIILVIISSVSIFYFRRRPYLFFGWFWFLITLVPVIGFIQLGNQSMADRYSYIPLIGLSTIVSFHIYHISENFSKRYLLGLITLILIFPMVILTAAQLQFWQNGVTLFEHAVELDKNNLKAHNNLGHALAVKGRHEEAISHFKKALGNNKIKRELQYNIAKAYQSLGEYDKAIQHYKSSLAIDPDYIDASLNLGTVYYHLKDYDNAVYYFMNVLRINPGHAGAHNNLGVALLNQNKTEKAIYHFNMAIKSDPKNEMARKNLIKAKK